jgi:hypothetical protein
MRRKLAAAVVACALLPATGLAADKVTDAQIAKARKAANDCLREFGVRPYDISKAKPKGDAYRRWVLRLWTERAATCRLLLLETRNPSVAIRVVFGEYAGQALAVASCESGHRTWAQNGQYLGMFQMGDYARSTFGHSDTALGQAQAAYRYFAASGYDWSPWQCRPSGGLAW